MSARRWLPLLLFLAVPLVALSEGPGDPEPSSRALEKYRADPARFARLRQDLHAYLALPLDRQQQLRKLDQELHDEPSSAQFRLYVLMERYAEWLDQLPEGDRQFVVEAPDKATRLQRIRVLREREWLQRQPLAIRQNLEKLPTGKTAAAASSAAAAAHLGFRQPIVALSTYLTGQLDARALVGARLRSEERKQHHDWQIANRHWEDLIQRKSLPVRPNDFGPEVRQFVDDYLRPILSKEERKRLDAAEGRWPQYPYLLVELADRHPLALPGEDGPRTLKDLPKDIQNAFNKPFGGKGAPAPIFTKDPLYKGLKAAENKWPDFGHALAKFGAEKRLGLSNRYEFLPTTINDLSVGMKLFVQGRLLSAISKEETNRFFDLERQRLWPEFPLFIQELSNKYNLNPPWQTLPGPREKWNLYRLKPTYTMEGYPELPEHRLKDFLTELDLRDREALKLTPADPQGSKQRLTEEFFKRRPDELQKIRQKDAQNQRKGDQPQKGPRLEHGKGRDN